MVEIPISVSNSMNKLHPYLKKNRALSSTSKSTIQLTLLLLLFASLYGVYLSHKYLGRINIQIEIENSLLENQRAKFNSPSSSSLLKEETYNYAKANPFNLDPYAHFPKPHTNNRGECSNTPVRFFVILTMQRSGSAWLESLLNSHPNISSNGEIFSAAKRRANTSSIIEALDEVYNLDTPITAERSGCIAAVRLKWHFNQGILDHYEAIVDYLTKKRVLVVFLFRRNLLCRLVSILADDHDKDEKQLNGPHKPHVHSKREAEVLAQFKPTISITTLISDLSSMEETMQDFYLRFNNTKNKLVYYEDILRNGKTLNDIQEFLGVPVRKLTSYHVKIHTRPTSELIKNWKDVRRILHKTKCRKLIL